MQLRYLLAVSVAGLSLASGLATPAAAQQITSGIQGTVTEESGTPVPGAQVTVTDTRTGVSRTLQTGATGTFVATNLTSGGPYTVSVTAPGLEGQSVEGIYTSLQGNTSLSFALSQGAGAIVVTGARVKATQLAVGPGTNFSTEVIENAPTFNRDVRDIIKVDPRVSLDRDDSSGQDRIACLGGNDRGNSFTVDGISQSDIYGLNGNGFASRSSMPIPYDAVREAQVQFAPFDVEYGQFTGCTINVITKSGSNKFHGSAFFEYSDSGMRGDKVADEDVAPVEPQKNWGASLGGPIIKDHLFFFGAYSHQETSYAFDDGPAGGGFPNEVSAVSVEDFNRVSDILHNVYGIDTGGLARTLPYKNDRYFGRLDWQVTDDHRLEATYQHLDESTMKRGDIFTSSSAPTIAGVNNFYNSGTKSDYYSVRLYSDWSDNFSTDIRYAHSKVQDIQDPVGGGEAQGGNPIPRIIVGVTDGNGHYGTINGGPDQYRTANDLRTWVDQAQAIGKLSVNNHQIKFGASYNQVKIFNLFVPNATGQLVFANIDDLEQGLLSDGTRFVSYGQDVYDGKAVGAVGNYTASGDVNDAAASFKRQLYSVFAQDEWQVSDRLSITGGIRVDWYDGDKPAFNQHFFDRYGRSNSVAFSALPPIVMPRASFTYDLGDFAVFSNSRFRAGVGVYSGGDPLVWFGNAFQNNGITYGEGSLLSDGCPAGQLDVVTNGTFTGVPSCLATAGGAQAAQGLADTQSIDPGIKTPSVLRFNADWQTDLDFADSGFFSGWKLNLDYIYSRYSNPFTVVDLSQVPDTREGLSGYTVDGRPIYAAIDPTAADCNATFVSADPAPVFDNVTPACFNTRRDDELMLTNSAGFTSNTASIILSKRFNEGIFTSGGSVFFTVGYAYTDANARNSMTSSTAGSNYDKVGAFDRQNLAEAQSLYASKHQITMQTMFTENFFSDLNTRLGITFTARSGRPFSLTFSDGGVFNDSASGSDNALLYIPTGIDDPNVSPDSNMAAVAELASFAGSLGCARGYAGRTIARNTCENDWYFDMDLTLSQELPGPGHLFGQDDKIRIFATVDNFLNLLDRNWNVLRHRTYTGLQPIADIDGVDSAGRYIITGFDPNGYAADNTLNTDASVWRLKVGVSYNF
jgi:hypothetical protein